MERLSSGVRLEPTDVLLDALADAGRSQTKAIPLCAELASSRHQGVELLRGRVAELKLT